ncbi:tRNA lysidine(34) synthetase TilS [Sulfitobacter sp. LCG007]
MTGPLAGEVARFLPETDHGPLGIAVSGGSDSLALLLLVSEIWPARDLAAVTVDHGLRPESGGEARVVGDICKELGIDHEVLRWQGWDGKGNLQERARRARYALMAGWAHGRGIGGIALGHTLDDQAETVLMRLARGSGVDGLSAMAPRSTRDGMLWLRPMLTLRRQELRDHLTARGLRWVDDPSNDDRRFDRVRVRAAMAALEELGIGAGALAAVAGRMQAAREVLESQVAETAGSIARPDAGAVVLQADGFRALPDEIARRLLRQALRFVSGSIHGPRHAPLELMLGSLRQGRGATVDGCQSVVARGAIWIFREYEAVRSLVCPADHLWDGRWRAQNASAGSRESSELELRALGPAGLSHCPDWRETGRPRTALLASPAIWRGDALVAAPFAGRPGGWTIRDETPTGSFVCTGKSH